MKFILQLQYVGAGSVANLAQTKLSGDGLLSKHVQMSRLHGHDRIRLRNKLRNAAVYMLY